MRSVGRSGGDLVVTDLDGTLWHTEHALHPATVAAFRQLWHDDVPLMVATGRRRGAAARGLRGFGVEPPAVVLNGGLGVDLESGDRFHRRGFTSDEARVVLEAFRAAGLDPCVYIDQPREVVISATPSTSAQHLASMGDDARTGDLDATVTEELVLMFSLVGLPHRPLVAAADQIGDRAEVHLDRSFDVPGMAAISVSPLGLSKWEGVQAWCTASGLSPARVIALGDGPNDVELLAQADVALVPDNAHPAALALADHLIPPPDDGGWARVLDHL